MLKSLVDSEEHKALLDTTAVILQDTPWYGELCGFGDNITTLWRYISREWFTNVQISQMVYLLQQSIEHSDVWRNKVEVVDGSFFVKLHSAHPNCVTNPGLYNSQQFRWLKKIGVSFETGGRERCSQGSHSSTITTGCRFLQISRGGRFCTVIQSIMTLLNGSLHPFDGGSACIPKMKIL